MAIFSRILHLLAPSIHGRGDKLLSILVSGRCNLVSPQNRMLTREREVKNMASSNSPKRKVKRTSNFHWIYFIWGVIGESVYNLSQICIPNKKTEWIIYFFLVWNSFLMYSYSLTDAVCSDLVRKVLPQTEIFNDIPSSSSFFLLHFCHWKQRYISRREDSNVYWNIQYGKY